MNNTFLANDRFDILTKEVLIEGQQFELSPTNIANELLKYYAKNKPVYLNINNQLEPVGKLIFVRGLEATVEMEDNMHGRFVRHMLYRAVDYNLSISGMGRAVTDDRLSNFKINKVIITDFVRWF